MNIKALLLTIACTIYIVIPVVYWVKISNFFTFFILLLISFFYGVYTLVLNRIVDSPSGNNNKFFMKILANFITASIFSTLYKHVCVVTKDFASYNNFYNMELIVLISSAILMLINIMFLQKLNVLLQVKNIKQEIIVCILNTFIILSYTDILIYYISSSFITKLQ